MYDIIEATIHSSDTGNLIGVGRGSDPQRAILSAVQSPAFLREGDRGRCGEYCIETYGVEADEPLGRGIDVTSDEMGAA